MSDASTPRTIGVLDEAVSRGLWLEAVNTTVNGELVARAEINANQSPYGQIDLAQYDTEEVLEAFLRARWVVECDDAQAYGLYQWVRARTTGRASKERSRLPWACTPASTLKRTSWPKAVSVTGLPAPANAR